MRSTADWWLDESSLPDLIWARLSEGLDGFFVDDCDGRRHVFETRAQATAFLSEDEYRPLVELQEDGVVAAAVAPPESPRRS